MLKIYIVTGTTTGTLELCWSLLVISHVGSSRINARMPMACILYVLYVNPVYMCVYLYLYLYKNLKAIYLRGCSYCMNNG
jgi:hypothetical protein